MKAVAAILAVGALGAGLGIAGCAAGPAAPVAGPASSGTSPPASSSAAGSSPVTSSPATSSPAASSPAAASPAPTATRTVIKTVQATPTTPAAAPATSAPAAVPGTPAAAPPPGGPDVTDPWAVVSAYYGDIESGNYAQAYALIGNGSTTGQSYSEFASGYSCTGGQDVSQNWESGDQVNFDLAATDSCTGDIQYYTGTDTVENGTIVAAQIAQTG